MKKKDICVFRDLNDEFENIRSQILNLENLWPDIEEVYAQIEAKE